MVPDFLTSTRAQDFDQRRNFSSKESLAKAAQAIVERVRHEEEIFLEVKLVDHLEQSDPHVDVVLMEESPRTGLLVPETICRVYAGFSNGMVHYTVQRRFRRIVREELEKYALSFRIYNFNELIQTPYPVVLEAV